MLSGDSPIIDKCVCVPGGDWNSGFYDSLPFFASPVWLNLPYLDPYMKIKGHLALLSLYSVLPRVSFYPRMRPIGSCCGLKNVRSIQKKPPGYLFSICPSLDGQCYSYLCWWEVADNYLMCMQAGLDTIV